MNGDVDVAAVQNCGGVLASDGIDLTCSEPPVIVGTSTRALPDLAEVYEELATHVFVDIFGYELTPDYGALLEGEVPVDFLDRIEVLLDSGALRADPALAVRGCVAVESVRTQGGTDSAAVHVGFVGVWDTVEAALLGFPAAACQRRAVYGVALQQPVIKTRIGAACQTDRQQ